MNINGGDFERASKGRELFLKLNPSKSENE
jgi:hypothetical protein